MSTENNENFTTLSMRAQSEYVSLLYQYSLSHDTVDETTQAKLYAQALETQMLKAPATAQFCPLENMAVSRNGNEYIVFGYVDAQNSYGAMIRTNYTLRVVKSDGSWKSADTFTPATADKKRRFGAGRIIGGVLIAVSILLDGISMFFIGGDYDMFKGLLIAGGFIFSVGLVIEILGWKL